MKKIAIYVICAPGGLLKIGISAHPKARFSSIQTGSPVPLKLAHVRTHQRAAEIEQAVHQRLHAHRTRGEWFAVTLNSAIAAIDEIARAFPPVPQAPRQVEPEQIIYRHVPPEWSRPILNPGVVVVEVE